MRKVDFSKQSLDYLIALPAKQARQIAEKIALLAEDAEKLPSEELKGYAPMRRLRASEYRIVFRLEREDVKIVYVGKRNGDEIYKLLERALKK